MLAVKSNTPSFRISRRTYESSPCTNACESLIFLLVIGLAMLSSPRTKASFIGWCSSMLPRSISARESGHYVPPSNIRMRSRDYSGSSVASSTLPPEIHAVTVLGITAHFGGERTPDAVDAPLEYGVRALWFTFEGDWRSYVFKPKGSCSSPIGASICSRLTACTYSSSKITTVLIT